MIYAMSDIHGYLDALRESMERITLRPEDRLVLLGDYIDYGPESGPTLRYICALQREHGTNRVIVLRGNHEELLLDWLNAYSGPRAGRTGADSFGPWSDWLTTDPELKCFRTLISYSQWKLFQRLAKTAPAPALNAEAARMVLTANGELMAWLRQLPYYYETERQIFVHAGIDEEAGDWWRYGTEESVFTGKYPPTTGRFPKDIIAGHVGTAGLAGDPDFHGVYFDGQSHYFLDGTVGVSGHIPILAYDEESGNYMEL